MIFNKMFFELLQEQNILKTSKTQPLVDAIRQRHPITFYYTGPQKPEKERVLPGTRQSGEPVALGLSKKGNLIIRVFVPSPNVSKKGLDKTQWRTFMVSRMSNVKIDDEVKFDEKRPQYKEGDDDSMSVTYVTSDWTNKPEVKKPRIVKSKPEVPSATATTEPTPSVEPTTTTTTPEEPKTTELPQPKTQTKPEKVVSKPEPTQTEPEPTEPKTQELPQPKQTEKPVANPEEDEENKNLQESIKNIKRLMFS
jgi:hypothetical protein